LKGRATDLDDGGTRFARALEDPALTARVRRRDPLRYSAGADPSQDRPAHVRAGSGIAWAGARLVLVQDDANFVALVSPLDRSAQAIPLPAGAGGRRQFDDARGNKAHKLDLEAITSIPHPEHGQLVLALGSGSTANRESVVVLRGLEDGDAAHATVEVHSIPAFYSRLRAAVAFAGSELNVEAAVHIGRAGSGLLRLLNRGNGAVRDGVLPVNATCDVSWRAFAAHLERPDVAGPPAPLDIVQYDLGALGGLALSFTDAAIVPSPDAERRCIVYTACAEASPDATRDGPVAGCAIGVIADGPEGIRARWALLRDVAGQAFAGKVEGIALRPGDPTRAYVVVDSDAPETPSELCEVALEGPWFAFR
jgi:hypothetical protein